MIDLVTNRRQPHRIGILILPQFTDLTLSSIVETLNIANWVSGEEIFAWSIVSINGDPVTASNGRVTAVEGKFNEAMDVRTFAIVAGFDHAHGPATNPIAAPLNRMIQHGVQLLGIESGIDVLAELDVLGVGPASAHWENSPGLSEAHPELSVYDTLYNMNGKIATCAGGAATLDFLISWIAELVGDRIAQDTADELLIPFLRGEDELQPQVYEGERHLVSRAISLIVADYTDPISVSELASALGVTRRTLERAFRNDVGESPAAHSRRLRLRRAQALLQQTSMSVTEVAVATGFAAVAHFSRTYHRATGKDPSNDRHQAINAKLISRRAV